ncbi:hypothetical protein niasHT_027155 [Heterodera trifolii]|uniref:Integrase catalytic domain-containing protein n=1 Tax=Heterodera trifolii TaxID=157864 RepID=A0ABD2JVD4_9BILA
MASREELKAILEAQQKQFTDLLKTLLPNVAPSGSSDLFFKINGQIPDFRYDPENDSTFSLWHERYGQFVEKDGQALPGDMKENAKSKWPEVVRMRTTTALATIEALRIVFTAHGLPEQIVSDDGPQLISKEFGDYFQSRGIVHTTIARYNPKSNGAAERFVQTFKQGMSKLQKEGMKQEIALSQFLLKYRVTPHPATELAPSEIFFGRRLRTLLDLVKPTAANEVEVAKMPKMSYTERMKRNFDSGTNARKNSRGQSADRSDGRRTAASTAEEQQQPEQPQQQANAEPRRSTRKRKKPKIFDPSA